VPAGTEDARRTRSVLNARLGIARTFANVPMGEAFVSTLVVSGNASHQLLLPSARSVGNFGEEAERAAPRKTVTAWPPRKIETDPSFIVRKEKARSPSAPESMSDA
jgi:hypothetical protein